MIKVIAFDLVGVLVREIDFPLNEIDSKIERLFGPNKNDEEFLRQKTPMPKIKLLLIYRQIYWG